MVQETGGSTENQARPSSSTGTMRLFKTAARERALTTMLRAMEHGRFLDAWKALKKHDGELPVPPHALERLGRWLADRGEPRKAALPLRMFLDAYPNHQDRATVTHGLAACLRKAGKNREASRLEADG